MKKAIAMVLCLVLLVIGTGTAFVQAASIDEANYVPIMPFWSFINSTTTTIGINNGRVVGEGVVIGISGVTTSVRVNLTIQRRVAGSNAAWATVASGQRTQAGIVGALSIDATALSGFEFRTRAVYTAWSGSQSETHTSYSGIRRV